MKLSYLVIIFTFLFSLQIVFAATAPVSMTTSSCTISSVLKMGSEGTDVQCLQKKIGITPDGVFGYLTKTAVVAFQTAQGLKADGIIGPLSQTIINKKIVNNNVTYPSGCASSTGYSITTGNKCDGSLNNTKTVSPTASNMSLNTNINNNINNTSPAEPSVPSNTTPTNNPNLNNIDSYVAAVEQGALKGGLAEDKLPLLKDKIMQEVDSSTNLLQQFFDIQKAIYEKKISENTSQAPLWAFLDKAASFMGNVFSTKKVFADAGAPFGGYVTYVNPAICDCSGGAITQIFVSLPTNPNITQSNLLLDYLNGSQAFSYYNMPLPSTAVLGFYFPGVVSCYTYVGYACVPIVSDGLVSPETGSSL